LRDFSVILRSALVEAALQLFDAFLGAPIHALSALDATPITLVDERANLLPIAGPVVAAAPTTRELELHLGEGAICKIGIIARDVAKEVRAAHVVITAIGQSRVRRLVMRAELHVVLRAQL